MVNTKLLRAKIAESGLKYVYIADKLGLSRYGLQLKIDGKNDFFTEEVNDLCDLLGVTSLSEKEEIFF